MKEKHQKTNTAKTTRVINLAEWKKKKLEEHQRKMVKRLRAYGYSDDFTFGPDEY